MAQKACFLTWNANHGTSLFLDVSVIHSVVLVRISKNAGVSSRLISSRLASPRSHTRVCVRSDWDILTSTTEWITETSKNKDVPWFAFQVRKQAF